MSKNVSIFKNYSETTNPEIIDFYDYLEKIRDGEWQDTVLSLRTLKTFEEQKAYKATMPTTSMSGEFAVRKDDGIVAHNGFLAIDLDDTENLEMAKLTLQADRYVLSCFVSAGGKGLRVVFKVEPKKHREAFSGISEYLLTTYNLTCDSNGINVSKPYIVSYDPYLYINPQRDATPLFKMYVKELPIKPISDFVHTDSDFKFVLSQIQARRVNICEGYNEWLKVGFAIAEQFGKDGEDYFISVSSFSKKFSVNNAKKQYKYCLLHKTGNKRVNISTFYYLAQMHGISITTEETKLIIRTTKSGKRAGLSKETIAKNLLEKSGIINAEETISKAFDSLGTEKNENSLLDDIELFIGSNFNLKMNAITGFIENNSQELSTIDLNSMFVSGKKLFPTLDYQLMMRLLKSDFVTSYNPLLELLESDGVPHILPPDLEDAGRNENFESPIIDDLCSTVITEDAEYARYFIRKWIVGLISLIHGVHSPLFLYFFGKIQTGKTEWFRRLLPREWSSFFAESKLDRGKDDEILMCENLLILDDEGGGKSKKEAENFKATTSKQWFSLRRPYGDRNEKIMRLAGLGATGNTVEVVYDTHENRRLIPIEVLNIDKKAFNKIDKKQLFMEAYELYTAGFDWRINKEDLEYLNKNIERYEVIVAERELIAKYFNPGEDEYLTTTEIKVYIEMKTGQRLALVVIGRELTKAGFIKKSVRTGELSSKKWGVKRLDNIAIIPNPF